MDNLQESELPVEGDGPFNISGRNCDLVEVHNRLPIVTNSVCITMSDGEQWIMGSQIREQLYYRLSEV